MVHCILLKSNQSSWLAQSPEHVTPELRVVRSGPMLGVEITQNLKKKKREKKIAALDSLAINNFIV